MELALDALAAVEGFSQASPLCVLCSEAEQGLTGAVGCWLIAPAWGPGPASLPLQ